MCQACIRKVGGHSTGQVYNVIIHKTLGVFMHPSIYCNSVCSSHTNVPRYFVLHPFSEGLLTFIIVYQEYLGCRSILDIYIRAQLQHDCKYSAVGYYESGLHQYYKTIGQAAHVDELP